MTLVQHELQNAYIGEYVPPIPYLCFTANTANSTVQLTKTGSPTAVTLETSTDGKNWSTYTFGSTITLSNIGDKVYWRNTSETDTGFSTGTSDCYKFVMTGSIAGSGDVTYLLNKNSTTTSSARCFVNLFNGCTSLTTAPELPATTVGHYSYYQMFMSCYNMITAPQLPATTLGQYCYYRMFYNCAVMEQLPALPALTLQSNCYREMFNYCSKIKMATSQTGEYQTPYRIPTTGTGTSASGALTNMFENTGGTATGSWTLNDTYYTSNTVV